MTESLFLKDIWFTHTMDEGRILEGASLRIEDGTIRGVGRVKKERGDEVLDCRGAIVMPGLVNSHTHSPMVLLRGLNDDAPLDDWLKTMWEVEEKITPEIEELGAEWGFIEMLLTGTTSCLDMYGSFNVAGAAERLGIRVANGPPLISRFAPADERLKDARRYVETYRGHERITPVVNLHSIYTNDTETIAKAGELSRGSNVPLHVHCSETREEVFENRKEWGRLAVEELNEQGALWEKTVLAHLGWASSGEFRMIRDTGAGAVHCPVSNQKLGTGGFFPFRDVKDLGITVGLGTDGAASNNSLDMFREMKAMALLQKGQYWDPGSASSDDVLRCATVNGNRLIGSEGGMLKEGLPADMIVLDADSTLMPLRKDTLGSALVYSATGSLVRTTIICGEICYDRGILRDGKNARERVREIAKRTLPRLY